MERVAANMKQEILGDPDFAKHSHLATMMGRETAGSAIQDKFVQTMIRFKFKLMISYGEFITSDNPGWSIGQDNQLHNIKFDEDFHYLVPLTPKHCLSISYNDLDNDYARNPSTKKIYAAYVDDETIAIINRLSVDHFSNYLFASDKAGAERAAGQVRLKQPLP